MRYLSQREDGEDPRAPLFLAKLNRAMRHDTLRQLVQTLGNKAKVHHAHPHRFRHTLAITYLRCGGDLFALQRLLGHGSLGRVQDYARLAQAELEQAHRRASPVDTWRLQHGMTTPKASDAIDL